MKRLPDFETDTNASTPPPNRERLFPLGKGRAILFGGLRVVGYLLYLVMLFLRGPVQLVARFLTVPMIVFAVVWGLISGWTSRPTLVLGGGAFVLFLVSYLFDSVLLFLAPRNIQLDV